MTTSWNGLLRGAAAGAVGTAAPNGTTQLDTALRGRAPRDAPDDLVPHLVHGVTTHAALASALPATGSRSARPPVAALLRAAAVGAATGSRSSIGVAALAFTSTPADRGAVVSRLGGRAGATAAGLLAATELVLDKRSSTPARTAPPGLAPRAVLGAATAAGVARRDGHHGTLAAVVGLSAALGTAVLGVRVRAAAERRFGSDLPGAVAEDLVAAGLGWFATRR